MTKRDDAQSRVIRVGATVVVSRGGEGDGEIEAAGAATAWVEVEDSCANFDEWLVGVAGDDGGYSGGGRVQVEVGEGVDEVKETACELDGLGCGKLGAGAVDIDVAADGGYGGDG